MAKKKVKKAAPKKAAKKAAPKQGAAKKAAAKKTKLLTRQQQQNANFAKAYGKPAAKKKAAKKQLPKAVRKETIRIPNESPAETPRHLQEKETKTKAERMTEDNAPVKLQDTTVSTRDNEGTQEILPDVADLTEEICTRNNLPYLTAENRQDPLYVSPEDDDSDEGAPLEPFYTLHYPRTDGAEYNETTLDSADDEGAKFEAAGQLVEPNDDQEPDERQQQLEAKAATIPVFWE